MSKTVVVGMSGGVDSSVAALLLKEQGYNVIGLFMKNWQEQSSACTAEEDYADVRRVCSVLDIPYYTVNFSKEYMERVFAYFLSEYKNGRTPNPDVLCNREIKFGPFKEYAKKLGASYIATGHYCGIRHSGGTHYLLQAKDKDKDQTYFLNQLTQPQLSNVLFPLGDIEKKEVRRIAAKNNLYTATKKDSTGICFIGERNFKQFLQSYLPARPGKIVNIKTNKVIGEHSGLMYYTIGQRKGLGLGGVSGEEGRWFVSSKNLQENTLYVSHGDESVLFSKECNVSSINWIAYAPNNISFNCQARFRHRQELQNVCITVLSDSNVNVVFEQKQRAITPGQYAVFYLGDMCIGGGIVENAIY